VGLWYHNISFMLWRSDLNVKPHLQDKNDRSNVVNLNRCSIFEYNVCVCVIWDRIQFTIVVNMKLQFIFLIYYLLDVKIVSYVCI